MLVSRFVGLFGFILLVVSLVFPWFVVDTGVYVDRLTLADVKKAQDISRGICIFFGWSDCPAENRGLPGYTPWVILLVMVLNLFGSFVPELFMLSGFIGLLWSGIIYNDPARMIAGDLSPLANQVTRLDLGFYIFFASSLILLVAGVIGLIERFRRRREVYW